jgi:hypothetical protein
MVRGNSVVLVVLFQCNLLLLSGVLDVSSCSGIRLRIEIFRNNDKYISLAHNDDASASLSKDYS